MVELAAQRSEEMAQTKEISEERWTTGTTKIETWIEKNPNLRDDDEIGESIDIIELYIRRGARNIAKRLKFWNQILGEGRDFPKELNWPIKQGKESTLPVHVRESVNLLGMDAYAEAMNDVNNSTGEHSGLTLLDRVFISARNKTLGGLQYSSQDNGAELYAKSKQTSTQQRFTKLFNDGVWNGHLGDQSNLHLLIAETDEASEDEEE